MRFPCPRSFLCLPAVLFCVTFVGPAFADEAVLTYTFDNDIGLLPQFNPLLGQLQDVTVSETLVLDGYFDIGCCFGDFGVLEGSLTPSIAYFVNSNGGALLDAGFFSPPPGDGISVDIETPDTETIVPFEYEDAESLGATSILPYIGTGSLDFSSELNTFEFEFERGLNYNIIYTENVFNMNVTYGYIPSAPEPSYAAVTAALFGLLAWRGWRRRRLERE